MSKKDHPVTPDLFPAQAPEVASETVSLDLIDGPLLGEHPGADLVTSVARLGILSPVLLSLGDGGRYRVVDGRRRVKAARQANLSEVPALIVPSEFEHSETLTLTANFARKANPVSEFVAIRDLVEKGWDERTIAKSLRVPIGTVRKRLSLGKLKEVWLDLLENGFIGASVGEALAKLSEDEQEELLDVFAANGDKLTLKDVSDARRVARREQAGGLSDLLFGGQSASHGDAQAALSHIDALEVLLSRLGETAELDSVRERLVGLLSRGA